MTSCRHSIAVVGSYMRDTVLRTPHLPRPGETIAAAGLSSGHGGKGSNQAVQAARGGADVSLIGAIGDDTAAQAARALWISEGIAHTGVACYGCESTGMAFITVDASGENHIVIAPGANGLLSPEDVERNAADLAAAAVVAQLETPIAATIRAFELARHYGGMTVLNAAPLADPHILLPLLALTDLVVCNRGEAQALLGNDERDPARLSSQVVERIGCAALVTAGPYGAFLQTNSDQVPLYQPAITPRCIADTTGAGDAFIGAFLCRWVETRDWQQALLLGAAAGAIACEAPGATASLAMRSVIQQRLA